MRTMMAGERTKAWQFERQDAMMQYTQAQETAAALQGAGTQNIMGGISTGVMAAGGGFGGGSGMSKKKTAYGEYSTGMDITNRSQYDIYSKGVGKDALGYTDWQGMEGTTYENPFSYNQWTQDWRQQRRSNPSVQLPWKTSSSSSSSDISNTSKVPFESYSDLTREPTPADLARYNSSVFKNQMTFEDYFAWEQKVQGGFHKGGTVTGDNPNIEGEDVSAVLQEGEVVINADAAKQNVGLLSQINQSTGGNPLSSYTMQTLASDGGGTGLSDDITVQLALDESAPPSEAALNLFSQLQTEAPGIPI